VNQLPGSPCFFFLLHTFSPHSFITFFQDGEIAFAELEQDEDVPNTMSVSLDLCKVCLCILAHSRKELLYAWPCRNFFLMQHRTCLFFQDVEYKTMLLEHYVTRVTGGGLREHDVGLLKLKQVMI
jgi:hypothetical protein